MVAVTILQLVCQTVSNQLTDPLRCPLPALPQIDVDSLFQDKCMPAAGEYLLGALLLAAQLGGDVVKVKQWVQDCKKHPTGPTQEWRNQLAQFFCCITAKRIRVYGWHSPS